MARRRSGFLLLAVLVALPLSAGAYEILIRNYDGTDRPIRWAFSGSPIEYRHNPQNAPTNVDLVALADAAYQTWTDVSSSQVAFSRGADTSQAGGFNLPDGISMVSHDDPQDLLPTGVLAAVASHGPGTHSYLGVTYYSIEEADMVFNDGVTFTDSEGASLSGGCLPGSAKFDGEAVALHEIGHVMGLDHAGTYSTAVMYQSIAECDPNRTSPRADDVDGATFLYDSGVDPIYPGFAMDSPRGYVPFEVAFTDETAGAVATSWSWNFGDGSISAEQNPTHEYGVAGAYKVALTVNGSTTVEEYDAVQAFERPEPEFQADVREGERPLEVRFSNLTPDTDGLVWHWDFGDGATSTAFEATHLYESEGLYAVTLRADGGAGYVENRKAGYIQVGDPDDGLFGCTCRVDADASGPKWFIFLALVPLGALWRVGRARQARPSVSRAVDDEGF